jgi:hypothetical protein
MVVDEAVDSLQQEVVTPPIDARRTKAPALTEVLHGHMVHQEVNQYNEPVKG